MEVKEWSNTSLIQKPAWTQFQIFSDLGNKAASCAPQGYYGPSVTATVQRQRQSKWQQPLPWAS